MDSNRRHQLAENSLAKWFNTQYEEWIAPNSGLLSTLVLVILIVLCAVMIISRYMEWQKATEWKKFYSAFNAENFQDELQALAETSKEPVKSRAQVTLAQVLLSEGCNLAATDKDKAVTQLENAAGQFEQLQNSAPTEAFRQQAAFGFAQAKETLASLRTGEDLVEAEKAYRKIADQWPDSYYGVRAAKQQLLISQVGTKTFLEKSIAKAAEQPKAEDFKVEIDTKDPFMEGPQGFDIQKALDGDEKPVEEKSEMKPEVKPEPATEEKKDVPKEETKPEPTMDEKK